MCTVLISHTVCSPVTQYIEPLILLHLTHSLSFTCGEGFSRCLFWLEISQHDFNCTVSIKRKWGNINYPVFQFQWDSLILQQRNKCGNWTPGYFKPRVLHPTNGTTNKLTRCRLFRSMVRCVWPPGPSKPPCQQMTSLYFSHSILDSFQSQRSSQCHSWRLKRWNEGWEEGMKGCSLSYYEPYYILRWRWATNYIIYGEVIGATIYTVLGGKLGLRYHPRDLLWWLEVAMNDLVCVEIVHSVCYLFCPVH